ncbi:hypothetical protein PV327_005494 [Microctonus hyperodae]|uniref:Gustatory receptor n=2 Tax=Microctonus hyperodae TaxID=165561 RepID=A0AA39G1G8_MICHY|nr:hypothetical protein PV327_005494 [Microctonus hyperodae]
MKIMKNKRNVRMAWHNTINVMSSAELRKRPLTMQIRAFAQRSKKKKYRGSESPLYAATCPLIYVTRVFGLAPYEFDDNQQILVPSDINIIYSIIWFCVNTYIIYTVLLSVIISPPVERHVLQFTEMAKAIFNYGVVIFELVLCLYTRKQITKIWNEIQEYDEIICELGYARKEKKTCIWIWSIIAFSAVIWIAINQLGMYAFDQSWIDNVLYMILYVNSATGVVKFSGLVMLLGQRFNQLIDISQRNMLMTPTWLSGTPIINVKIIEHLHNDMMVIAENLNTIFSWSMMFWLGNLCLHSVSDIYFVMAWISAEHIYWKLIRCLLAWIFLFISQIILLCYACHYTSSQANCINYIIFRWKRQQYMRNKNMEIETSFHLLNRQLHFCAAGCFNINLPLLRSIAASLTTYLVILLQFD